MENFSVTRYDYTKLLPKFDRYNMDEESDSIPTKVVLALFEEDEEFGMGVFNPFFENIVLRKSLINLWKAYKYDQEYISFLLETTSKEKFLEKAKEFAQSFEKISEDQLYYGANLLLNILDQPLTSADISLFFNIDPNNLDSNDSPLLEYDLKNTNSK